MSDHTATDQAIDHADHVARAAAGFLVRLRDVRADQWDNPTPCPAWTARDVAAHVINEQRRTFAQLQGRTPQPLHGVAVAEMGVIPELSEGADLVAAWAEISAGLVEVIADPASLDVELPTPMGPVPFRVTVDAFPEDILIHTWDLARATGGDERLDLAVLAHVYEHLKPMDEFLRQPWAFGPRATPPPGADLQTEFLCFTGRQP